MPHKDGDIVKIFEDPLTEQRLEGEAKLISKVREDNDREYWVVEFTRDHSRCPRWIKKSQVALHRSNTFTKSPEERAKLKRQVDDVLQHMIEDEIQAQKEYEQIASVLRDLDYPAEAETIEKIKAQEVEHMNTLLDVKRHVRLLSYAH